MKKEKFNIEFRKDIESGKLKVETAQGEPVIIYTWNCGNTLYPIIASVNGFAYNYSKDGEILYSPTPIVDGHKLDLYVVSLPDISDFEKVVMDVIGHSMDGDYDYPQGDEKFDESRYDDIKGVAALLQEEVIKDFVEITTAYSTVPEVKHDTQGGGEYVHYMNFRFYPHKLLKLDWLKRKYFPGLSENKNSE